MTILKLNTLENELNELFDGNSYTGKLIKEQGGKALLHYLKSPIDFEIVSLSAVWTCPIPINLNGKLGKHLCIKLPGDRICELEKVKDRSWDSLKNRQMESEIRRSTGKEIEAMWRMHLTLTPKYREWGTLDQAPQGLINYRFFTNDCFTYVNRILKANHQEETHLRRFASSHMGSYIEDYFVPKKLRLPTEKDLLDPLPQYIPPAYSSVSDLEWARLHG